MKMLITTWLGLCWLTACTQENKDNGKLIRAGGPCEGCEAIYEAPLSFDLLKHTDTLPEFSSGAQQILIHGKVFKADGKTPAPGIVIYAYHTNADGVYPMKGNETGWAQRHGYLRGWVKTDKHGAYQIYTTRPGSYPNSSNPQHIHFTIKEPGYSEYYIDDIYFTDDPLLPANPSRNARGGSGLVKLEKRNNLLAGERNIFLGKHIPGYK